jgi:hypothetical protein
MVLIVWIVGGRRKPAIFLCSLKPENRLDGFDGLVRLERFDGLNG